MSKSSGGLCGQQSQCGERLPSRVQQPETHLFLGKDKPRFLKIDPQWGGLHSNPGSAML